MRKEQLDIVARLQVLEAMCFNEPKKVQIINEVIAAVQKVGGDRPEGADPRLQTASIRDITRESMSMLNAVSFKYVRRKKRLYAFRIIRWLAHLAIEKLESGMRRYEPHAQHDPSNRCQGKGTREALQRTHTHSVT